MTTEQLYTAFRSCAGGVTTDSRKIAPNSIFFALKGDNFDGNQYAEKALDAGASFAVIDNAAYAKDERYLVVADTLRALQALATRRRRDFSCPFLGITGSNGKTTTKEILSAVAAQKFKTHFTAGNLNNHIGVPLTLLALPDDTEFAVIEMGANHQGEIAELSAIAEPTHGIITNIGKAHLEGFGGVEGVKKGKSELYKHLAQHTGIAFVNTELEHLDTLATAIFSAAPERVIRYGTRADVKTEVSQPFIRVSYGDLTIQSQLVGDYNFHNILAAITIGEYFGITAEQIKAAIEAYSPQNSRSQLLAHGDNTFIMDAYNANPTSMSHALTNFGQLIAPRKGVILGNMLELGEDSPAEHQQIADLTANLDVEIRVFVGELFENTKLPTGALYFSNSSEAAIWFAAQAFKNVLFLVKGSRGSRMERVVGL